MNPAHNSLFVTKSFIACQSLVLSCTFDDSRHSTNLHHSYHFLLPTSDNIISQRYLQSLVYNKYLQIKIWQRGLTIQIVYVREKEDKKIKLYIILNTSSSLCQVSLKIFDYKYMVQF